MVPMQMYAPNETAMIQFGQSLGNAVQDEFVQNNIANSEQHAIIVFLTGDLGAGKTTFTRGVLQAFGHQGAVKSPTYTLVEPYEYAGQHIYHFDLYRLGDPEELEFMGVRDYFTAGNLCLIEWPDCGRGFLPDADINITVKTKAPGRKISFEVNSATGRSLLKKLEAGISVK